MAEIQRDSSSDSEDSDVLEGTPVKENYTNTLIMGPLVNKNMQLQCAALSEPEKSPLRKKEEKLCSLNCSSVRHTEDRSKSFATVKQTQSKMKSKEMGMLRSSSSLQAHLSSEEAKKYGKICANMSLDSYSSSSELSDEDINYIKRDRRCAVVSAYSETYDTAEESLQSLKLASKVGKHRERRNVILSSDSEESVTDKAKVVAASYSPDIRVLPSLHSYREKKGTTELSDSEAVDVLEKNIAHDISRSKYRETELIIESSDSEDRSVNEDIGRPSISDEPSLETTLDENISIEEVDSNSENGNTVLETSNSGTFPDQDRVSKLSVQSTVELSDSLVKTVKECDHTSDECVQELTANGCEIVQENITVNKNKTVDLESDASFSVSTILRELPTAHLARTNVNFQSDFQPNILSVPELCASKETVQVKKVQSLEESLHAMTISAKKNAPVETNAFFVSETVTDNMALIIAQKKRLQSEIASAIKETEKLKVILRSINLASLPDRGTRLQMSLTEKETMLKKLKEQWKSSHFDTVPDAVECVRKPDTYKIRDETLVSSLPKDPAVMVPRKTTYLGSMPSTAGMGQRALQTHTAEKAMTVDTLKHLLAALESCPGEDVIAEAPKALRSSVELMPHQKNALAWLMWRESHKPYGGILADDMGLGKTLTMISLVLKAKEESKNNDVVEEDADSEKAEEGEILCSKYRKYESGGTLVVCPASLLNQWEEEVKKRVKRGVIDLEIYHGTSRESRPRQLAKRDMVVTTYNIVRSEGGVVSGHKGSGSVVDHSKQGTVFGVKWERIVLDEAHTIRNHKSQTSIAICALKAKYRWAVTGTPMHNKELDLYSLLKFLRCSPFDDLTVWRRWVDKSAGGMQRLNTVLNSLMLHRTKKQLQSKGGLTCLPQKQVHKITVKLDEEEFRVYKTVLIFSRTLFAQFLAQKIEKEQMMELKYGQSNNPTYMQDGKPYPHEMNDELKAMHQKMKSMGDVKTFQILVLLLRLRQICCHPGLIESMLDKESCENDGIEDEHGMDADLLSQLSKMGLDDKDETESVDADGLLKKKVLVQSNPVFKKDRISSKMRALFIELQEKVMNKGDNAVIVSQFTSVLDLVHQHLKENHVKCLILTGSVPVKERMALVDEFNNPLQKRMILLLSLTAGGVGLNLIGGNHLFLLDPHWNPQLEAQAFDRIYRVGQKKSVHIYKFISEETIEQQIEKLQSHKMALASSVLTGTKRHGANRLSLDDLKMLFNFQAIS